MDYGFDDVKIWEAAAEGSPKYEGKKEQVEIMNDLRLKSIFDLLDKNYFIPSYQRGYRWEKRQIEDLLDDLYAFAKSKKDVESFYCLQPVILKPCDSKTIQENHLNSNIDNNKWYEVIDGQQRLTTIYIIFKYFVKN